MAGGLGIGLNLGALTSGGDGSSYAAVAGLLWELPSESALNGDFEELSDELTTNGDFSTNGTVESSTWTLGFRTSDGGISIADGILDLVNEDNSAFDGRVQFTNGVDAVLAIENSKSYVFEYEITENSSNSNFFVYTGGSYVSITKTVGRHKYYFESNGTAVYVRNGGNNSTIKLSSVSLKKIDPNDRWTLGTGWSIEDGKLNFDTDIGDGTVSSTNILTVNNTYTMTFDVNITDGVLRFESGDGDNFLISSSGTYTHQFKADLLAIKFRRNETPTRGYIDNVSVKEFELKPYATGRVSDYNLAWDLDGLNYMPQASPTTDGNWEVVSGELIPKEI